VILEEMTKQQLIDHAKEVHGVELDKKTPRPELINAIKTAATTAATTPAAAAESSTSTTNS
jgi:hypothetical protein